MNTIKKTEFLGMKLPELEDFFVSIGEPAYRARQVYRWIYQKQTSSFYEMSDLPKELRQHLDERAEVSIPRVLKQRVSSDNTRKFLLEMKDKKKIETVIIPQSNHKNTTYTLCISSQVGCPVGCSFCATGTGGFQRNLEAYEIVGQVLGSQRELSKRLKKNGEDLISNIVFMGMGEPFLNFDEVLESVYFLNDHKGINIGQRHITISTSGDAAGIDKLAQTDLQVTLAISLHACDNKLRDDLVPMNRKYPLDILMQAIKNYIEITNRRVTFEYVMLDGVNIRQQDAEAMIKMLKPLLANVNLIPYNEVSGLPFKKPSPQSIAQFYKWLVAGGLNVNLREEHGSDIEAACGQLLSRRER
ncbi:Ribosomal RNA large subunit methyltransferase RlmN/Cfr [Syntrophomonas zehnderi OL-4]|uniref:Probable dual-specificity RNA methyltransferase RlmN n=1 Tax=Syntrophomonas zehnderi OL-4 TaxID=690567 RepID=A0A0E3W3F0_9FIRM|nr:23S rRNA (adenine(2503)-C(2))-methyltransferase RlmN [Syntrophomonas zehnderi]CFX77349.1 Ribosomal RNA large subunit methyltransferase RlmN/Cfr [Syntrophomonas zehnderi OL-4]